MSETTKERMVSLMVCETCKSEVPAQPYCARCGAVLLGAAAVFTEAAAVSTYSEAAPEEDTSQDDVLARLGLIDITPAVAAEEQESSSTNATPADSEPADVVREERVPLEQGDELDAALARTNSDPQPLTEAEGPAPDESLSGRGWWGIVTRWWWVGAAGLVLLLLLGGLVVVGVSSAASSSPAPRPSASPTSAQSQSGPLPGYGSAEIWGAAAKSTVVSADGSRGLVMFPTSSGTTARVYDLKKGKSLSSTDVAADAMPMVAGNTLLLRNGGTVLAWGPGATEPTTVPAPEGAALLARSGTGFLVDGAAVTVFTDGELVGVTAPRAGMVPLSYQPETQTVVWASSTGHLVTGAVTGSVVNDVALATPSADATLSGWIAATDNRAFITWTAPTGTVLAVHQLVDGAITGQAPISGDPIVSPSGTMIAAAGALVETGSGELIETEFVPAAFLNDQYLYGATTAGSPAVWHDGAAAEVTAGIWRPIAVTPQGLLASEGSGIALFPSAKN